MSFETATPVAPKKETAPPAQAEQLPSNESLEARAKTTEMLQAAEPRRNQAVAETIATVTGGRSFTAGEISKMTSVLGNENAFLQGLKDTSNEDAKATFETNAVISKAQYGDHSNTADYEDIAADMNLEGLDAAAVEEAMGYRLEENDPNAALLEDIRDVVEDFKKKHPTLFKVLKMTGLAGILLTASNAAYAAGPVVHRPVTHDAVSHGPVTHDAVSHGPVVHGPVSHGPVTHAPGEKTTFDTPTVAHNNGPSAEPTPSGHRGVPHATSDLKIGPNGNVSGNIRGGIDLSRG